jgi:hypothetical protein
MDGGEPPRYVVGRCGARIEVGASYPHPYCITNNEFVWSFVLILHHHEGGEGSKKVKRFGGVQRPALKMDLAFLGTPHLV